MVYLFKPCKPGAVTTGADLVDNTADSVKLLGMQDDSPYNNPDGAALDASTHPDFRGGHPQGAIRSETVSGKGMIHPTNMTTAPKSNPMPAPTSDVVTNPSSIKV